VMNSGATRIPMTETTRSIVSTPSRILAALRELIRALDRRVPHVERAGEARIARDAQRLRGEAVSRIKALQRAESDHDRYDQDIVEAIMTDDGAPRS
jgi:hypothetical protein